MTAFEQFVSQEYNRKEGEDVSDIYDEAVAKWRQVQTTNTTPNAMASDRSFTEARSLFEGLPDPAPVANQRPVSSEPNLAIPGAASYDQSLDLLVAPAGGSRGVFDDLPDTQDARRSQLTEMQIADAQQTQPQPEGAKELPEGLINQVWRGFSQDYADYTRRISGPMKSAQREKLVNDWNQGFADNYSPVLGNFTQLEAEQVAERAMKESRSVTTSDWKATPKAAQGTYDIDEVNKAITAAKGLIEFGREAEAEQILQSVGVVKPRNAYNDATALISENSQLQAAQRAGKFTMSDGTVLGKDEINSRMADNQDRLIGLRPELATAPSVEGQYVNINQLIPQFKTDKGINITKLNAHVSKMAEEYPGLMANMEGSLIPAAEFKYTVPTAAPEDGGGLALGLGDRGYDASGKGVAKLAKDVVRGSVEGLRKANDYAANTIYQATKGVGRELYVPGTGMPISGSWLKEFVDGLGDDEDSE